MFGAFYNFSFSSSFIFLIDYFCLYCKAADEVILKYET